MDYRTENFRKKFSDAARHFGVGPDEIVSVKVREMVNSYEEYREFVRMLEHDSGIHCLPVDGDLQGKGYLLSDGKVKVILVEHESGLEILYIAGSIASLVGLVPMILQGWRAFRNRRAGRHGVELRDVEIRRIDESGHLTEDRVRDKAAFARMPIGEVDTGLSFAAQLVESDLRQITNQMRGLTLRVEALERMATVRRKKSVPKPKAKGRRGKP